jgi:hypothetical protein
LSDITVTDPIKSSDIGQPSTGQVDTRLAEERDATLWNDYLATKNEPTGLARFAWQQVISRSYGNETRFYVALQNGRIVGALPGYVAKSLRGRRRFYPLRSGALVEDANVLSTLVDRVSGDASAESWLDWTVSHRGQPIQSTGATEKKTLVFRLGATEEDDWSGLSQKARNKIRKARKSGISIDTGPQYVDTVYDLYRDNMVRLGVTLHPRRLFHAMSALLQDELVWVVALKDRRPVGGMAVFLSAGGAIHDFQSADFSSRNEGPVQLLNWEAICLCRERGIPLLDFGESSEGSPVYQSKTGFGALPEPLTYYSAKPTHQRTSPPHQSTPSALMRITGLVHRRAPRPMKIWLSTALRSHGRIL